MELLLSLTMLLSSANALAQEHEQESDFSQPGISEPQNFEEYGPVKSALQEPPESIDEEMRESAGPTDESPRKIVKAKHTKKSKHMAAKAKHHASKKVAKAHSKKGRSLASVKKKSKNKKTTMAKRGSSQRTIR